MNSLLGHRKMTKKELHKTTTTCWHLLSAAGIGKRATQAAQGRLRSTRRTRQSFTLLAGFPVCRRRVPPAFTSHKMKVEPSFVVLSLVRGLQPDGRRDDVGGPVHDQPLDLRFREHNENAAFEALSARAT